MFTRHSLIVALVILGWTPWASAGITGENVAVIVNASSVDSITVANHYVALRKVPPGNVIWLDDVPSGNSVSLDVFRDKVLKPLLERINERKLAAQIQVVAYSAGFPTAVDISSHTRRLTEPNQKKYQTPSASINSLTYFYRYVLADSPDYLAWSSNAYARGQFSRHFINPFAGETRQRFEDAEAAAKEGEFAKAAKAFESLATEYPTMSPLRILAAKNWLNSGDDLKALQQIENAIGAGWASRRYLTTESPFREHFEVPEDGAPKPRNTRILDSLQDVPIVNQGPMPFASSVEWTANGQAVPAGSGAIPFLLSCVLAVVHPNGNTLDEATAILQRAATADRTYPDATFSFSKTKDVRVTTRQPLYADAIAWLLSRRQDTEIFPSVLPSSRKTYIGMMLGSASLPLTQRTWSYSPGALAENLTSLGGAFGTTSQTKLTEVLKAGAAISSGAVAEPYALVPKFPAPMIYPYYGEGITAIEAFYLSVASPYQLLIVGDPLCQPFARPPNDLVRMEAAEPTPSQAHAIAVSWQALPESPNSSPANELHLYLSGKLMARTKPVKNIKLNIPLEMQGFIDCRAVMVGRHPTKPAIAVRRRVMMGEHSILPQIQRLRKDIADQLTLYVDCPGADSMEVTHLGRTLVQFDGEASRIKLTAEEVGRGIVELHPIARRGGVVIHGDAFTVRW